MAFLRKQNIKITRQIIYQHSHPFLTDSHPNILLKTHEKDWVLTQRI